MWVVAFSFVQIDFLMIHVGHRILIEQNLRFDGILWVAMYSFDQIDVCMGPVYCLILI